jgi:pyrimidine operon attenuation protein/uracil phosphoribosyltransferase
MSAEAAEKSLVLNDQQINQKIKRMAYEIYENNFKEKSIVMAGIEGQGYSLANILGKELVAISSIEMIIAKVSLDKFSLLQSEVKIDKTEMEFRKKCVLLVDDVLNTGRVAVLVNRSHTLFPIMPTYAGYELSTTLKDHVEVVLGKKSSVYLH